MRTAEPRLLNDHERATVHIWVQRGHAAAWIQTRARTRLKWAEGWLNMEITRALEVGAGTVSQAVICRSVSAT